MDTSFIAVHHAEIERADERRGKRGAKKHNGKVGVVTSEENARIVAALAATGVEEYEFDLPGGGIQPVSFRRQGESGSLQWRAFDPKTDMPLPDSVVQLFRDALHEGKTRRTDAPR